MAIIKNDQDDIVLKIRKFDKTKELGKIIGLEGTSEILSLLDDQPLQYKDLDAEKIIPPATLNRRLKELQSIHLVKKMPITSNRRETHQYNLTLNGIELMKFIHKYEKIVKLPDSQQKIIKIENKK
jgi:DNA-binding HxlR family transcriptional regulator